MEPCYYEMYSAVEMIDCWYGGREGSSIARCDKCVMEHCNGTHGK